MITTPQTPDEHSSVSERKVEANRRNARKSTGPRTEEGKARSSQNAVTHGFFAQCIAVGPMEQQEFKEYRLAVLKRLQPRDRVELDYVEEYVACGWKLKRLRSAEKDWYEAHLKAGMDQREAVARMYGSDKPTLAPNAVSRQLAGDLGSKRSSFMTFQTYEQRLVNMMNRSWKQLKLLQDDELTDTLNEFVVNLVDQEAGKEPDKRNEPTEAITPCIPSTSSVACNQAIGVPAAGRDHPAPGKPPPTPPPALSAA